MSYKRFAEALCNFHDIRACITMDIHAHIHTLPYDVSVYTYRQDDDDDVVDDIYAWYVWVFPSCVCECFEK